MSAELDIIITDELVATSKVLDEIADERVNQDAKWGEQNHQSSFSAHTVRADAAKARNWKVINDHRVVTETLAWDGILLEEVYEALAETDPALLRAELVQVAAVAVAWIECIDRNAE